MKSTSTNKDGDPPTLHPKKTRANKTARGQNTDGSHSRGRKRNAVDKTDENVHSTGPSKPQRRSSRLSRAALDLQSTLSKANPNIIREPLPEESNVPPAKGIPKTIAKASRNVRTRSIAPPDRVHEPAVEDEIEDLRRQLEREKGKTTTTIRRNEMTYEDTSDKNRLLRRTAVTQVPQAANLIPKPKGSVGDAGFSLIAAMKLDKHKPEDKALYNDILVRFMI
jgi:hypothetical protein